MYGVNATTVWGILPICMHMYYICAWCLQSPKWDLITRNWSYGWLGDAMWVLGNEPSPLEDQSMLLTMNPFLLLIIYIHNF